MKFHDTDIWVFDVSEHTGLAITQICLPLRPADRAVYRGNDIFAIPEVARVGHHFCVTGENGGGPLGCIEVLRIASVDVRHTLSRESVASCGYTSRRDLLEVWAYRHDHEFYLEQIFRCKKARVRRLVASRPCRNYLAWLITFRPVP